MAHLRYTAKVTGCDREELVSHAAEQAKRFFGDTPHTLEDAEVHDVGDVEGEYEGIFSYRETYGHLGLD